MAYLLKNANTNLTSEPILWHGGSATLFIEGDLDGANIQLQVSSDKPIGKIYRTPILLIMTR